METYKGWISHMEFMVILVTLIGGFYTLDGKIERQGERTDKLYEIFLDNHARFHEELKIIHAEIRVINNEIKDLCIKSALQEERNKK